MAEKANKMETVDVDMEVIETEETPEVKESFFTKAKRTIKEKKIVKKVGIGLAIVGAVAGSIFVKKSLEDGLDAIEEDDETAEDLTDPELEDIQEMEAETEEI